MLKELLNSLKKETYHLEVLTDKGNTKKFAFKCIEELCDCLCDICPHVKPASHIYSPAEACDMQFIAWNGNPHELDEERYFWGKNTSITIEGYKNLIDYCLNLYGSEANSEKTSSPSIKINGACNNLYNTSDVNKWVGAKRKIIPEGKVDEYLAGQN